jgi:hypothetical protein
MPVRVNEFVIQAKFEDDASDPHQEVNITEQDLMLLKSEILSECLEKMEELLQKREGR